MSEIQIQEITSKLLEFAGVDNEAKPIVVIYGAFLPDPNKIDYNKLLGAIKAKLEECVENDYTIVFFTSGITYKPSWGWILGAYQGLDREFRKNIKNLYIVHSGLWIRMIMNVLGTVISYKFFKKIVWVYNLTHLKYLVPMKYMKLPQVVYEVDRSVAHIKVPVQITKTSKGKLFGHNIEELLVVDTKNNKSDVSNNSFQVYMMPEAIITWILYLNENGIKTEGIFRRSPASSKLREAKEEFDCEIGSMDCEELGGVHVIAVLLKMFFKELQIAIFDKNVYEVLKGQQKGAKSQVEFIKSEVLTMISQQKLQVLIYLFGLLHNIAQHNNENKMTSGNLTRVWAPNLSFSDDPAQDLEMLTSVSHLDTSHDGKGGDKNSLVSIGTLIFAMISQYNEIFEEEIVKIAGFYDVGNRDIFEILRKQKLKYKTNAIR